MQVNKNETMSIDLSKNYDSMNMNECICTLVIISGVMEDKGLLFGSIKFAGAGGSLSGDISVGIEKSPISLLRTIPVEGERIPAPKA